MGLFGLVKAVLVPRDEATEEEAGVDFDICCGTVVSIEQLR